MHAFTDVSIPSDALARIVSTNSIHVPARLQVGSSDFELLLFLHSLEVALRIRPVAGV